MNMTRTGEPLKSDSFTSLFPFAGSGNCIQLCLQNDDVEGSRRKKNLSACRNPEWLGNLSAIYLEGWCLHSHRKFL